MAMTTHLGITLLEQSQAQKEITVNEAFARIDALLNSGVIDRDLSTPPASPAEGDVYIVSVSPTGSWAGRSGQVAYFDQIWRFIEPNEGLLLWLNDENQHVVFNGTSWQSVVTSGGGGGSTGPQPMTCEGRLTLTSNTPVTISDVTAATTLFFTPYKGNRIALHTGTAWQTISFTQVSASIPAVANRMHDVWGYINSGALVLEYTAWTNDTTRATALALQDGVYVRSGDVTRRYLGSIRTIAAGQCEDSAARRYVWNYNHRVQRLLQRVDNTASWTYSAAAWRQANNNPANQVEFVVGVAEDAVSIALMNSVANSTATPRTVFTTVGLDNVTGGAFSFAGSGVIGTSNVNLTNIGSGIVSAGRHYLAWLEYGAGVDTQTWGGGAARGLMGTMLA